MSASPNTNRYSIEIKDITGKSLVFINVDWTDDEARAALSEILRLASRPVQSNTPSEPNRASATCVSIGACAVPLAMPGSVVVLVVLLLEFPGVAVAACGRPIRE